MDKPLISKTLNSKMLYSKLFDEKKFNEPHPFQGYDMYMLNSPVKYKCLKPCQLYKAKYNYLVDNLHQSDFGSINSLLFEINKKMHLSSLSFYINGKNTIFVNENNDAIVFEDKLEWMCDISIQGFKSTKNGTISPIWSLTVAKKG